MAQIFSAQTTHLQLSSRVAAALVLATALVACGGGDGENACLPEPAAGCTPSINTDFDSIYQSLFAQRCGTSGGACHGPSGRRGNLVLADATAAYSALLGQDGTHARVVPSDPGCSLLLQRLESDDPEARMPYGENKLTEGLRCAVRTWIENGAAR